MNFQAIENAFSTASTTSKGNSSETDNQGGNETEPLQESKQKSKLITIVGPTRNMLEYEYVKKCWNPKNYEICYFFKANNASVH